MSNGFRNLEELRETASQAGMGNLPDDVLICKYSLDANVNSNYAAQFFKPELVPLDCEEVLRQHSIESFELSMGFFPATAIVITLMMAGFFIWKTISKRSKGHDAQSTGVRWGAFGVFMAFLMTASFIFSHPLLHAVKLSLAYLVALPSVLFVIGYLFCVLRESAETINTKAVPGKEAQLITSRDNEAIWEIVAHEMEENIKNKSLWARSFAESNGNTEAAKAIYMRSRYDQLATENQKKIS